MLNTRLAGIPIVLLALAACSKAPDSGSAATTGAPNVTPPPSLAAQPAPAPTAHADAGVAWRKGDVDAAFAVARAENKPVFLYWGAIWCPPCNQVKATIFNRQDFIDRSRFFVPVYLDGDSPSAQKVGARFKVSGYPTMILLTPDGREITRLPGEVDAEQYMRVLAMGMSGSRPVRETLAAGLSSVAGVRAGLAAEDWRMLAYYSWITDEQQLVPKNDLAPTLSRLAKACPPDQAETATRLELQAMAAAAAGAKAPRQRADPVAVQRVTAVLADARRARENFDLLVYYAGSVTGYLTPARSAERGLLTTAWNEALDRFIADPGLATDDRLAAVNAKVELARLAVPKGALPEPLLVTVREQAARADRETTDVYARQSAISGAASVLADAGLLDESDALLTQELARSHSPYYFMLGLAANARKRGDNERALGWAEKAYAEAKGPATRLQWGVGYIKALIAAAPQDAPRIERAAGQVIGELEATPETFYDRNQRALERMGRELAAWNKNRKHDASLQRIRAQMASVCAKLPAADPARTNCDGALRPAKA
jgi:thioredoxin-like negative regulator of GroEL